jgi:hypothetical protein
MIPFEPLLQLTLAVTLGISEIGAGWLMVIEAVAEFPQLSVMVTV